MKRKFTLEFWMDEEWFVGRLKEVPGVFSQGASLDELENNIQDAYKLMLETEIQPELTVKATEKEVEISV
jgi:predicted RNase H-like HicB family nuclease